MFLGDDAPPAVSDAEKARSADLLRQVDDAVEALRREAEGLANARAQYRDRLEGPKE